MTSFTYNHTLRACYLGYITQAIVNNFAPLLFLTFASSFGLSLGQITLITTVNFLLQLAVDLLSAIWIDRIGYRKSIVAAHVFAALGLASLALLPFLGQFTPKVLPLPPYAGIMTAVVLYAVGGGLIEVLISPIVESCPTERKAAAMSLLHSFYCWGHLAVILVSTLFFSLAGIGHWRMLSCLWALLPLANAVFFCFVPIYAPPKESVDGAAQRGSGAGSKTDSKANSNASSEADSKTDSNAGRGLLKNGTFWLLFLLMICAGGSEQGMSQWASAFAESALHVAKSIGDLAGPAAFALCMGTARALYSKYSDRLPLRRALSLSAALCIVCYLTAALSRNPILSLAGCAVTGFSVGVFWPGTFSIAARVLPKGGTAMYALLALAGDVGCSSGPSVVGFVANAFPSLQAHGGNASVGGNLCYGLLAAMVFPIGMLVGVRLLGRRK